MERRVYRNVNKAKFLHEQAIKAGLKHGCHQVAIQAVGGDIHPQELLYSENGTFALKDKLARRGLTFDWALEIKEAVDRQELNELLQLRLPEQETGGRFTGHYFVIRPIRNGVGTSKGHAFAVIPRDHMRRDTRKRLKCKDMHLVIDSLISSGVGLVRSDDLADYINNYYAPPRKLLVARIKKFRDVIV